MTSIFDVLFHFGARDSACLDVEDFADFLGSLETDVVMDFL